MTSHELAKKLLEMPDVMVTVSGYEGGVNEIEFVSEPAELALNVNDAWYYGKHDYTREYAEYSVEMNDTTTAKKVMGIHIG